MDITAGSQLAIIDNIGEMKITNKSIFISNKKEKGIILAHNIPKSKPKKYPVILPVIPINIAL